VSLLLKLFKKTAKFCLGKRITKPSRKLLESHADTHAVASRKTKIEDHRAAKKAKKADSITAVELIDGLLGTTPEDLAARTAKVDAAKRQAKNKTRKKGIKTVDAEMPAIRQQDDQEDEDEDEIENDDSHELDLLSDEDSAED
jgi:hypothetical protein